MIGDQIIGFANNMISFMFNFEAWKDNLLIHIFIFLLLIEAWYIFAILNDSEKHTTFFDFLIVKLMAIMIALFTIPIIWLIIVIIALIPYIVETAFLHSKTTGIVLLSIVGLIVWIYTNYIIGKKIERMRGKRK